ncbi:PaaI family thioesterase [Streptomyces radicis]|uniref:Hotdog fold thioesterase n=1 Tax=Streptomyces radicis TaxID=1750517 RepID=A0A3A9W9V1_9ACTN|nr:hotdog fold thioesterase [Streptomyces radicis]RKN04346.1 hotdog fold thioesterase [Streptomyces radicis]RKN14853.1 hotdog fold thioesterase [Streptomyces radicis]
MGDRITTHFPPHVVDQWAGLGLDVAALFSAGSLGERMGVSVLEASPEKVIGTLPVEGNTQPYGLLHGGASAVLAETLGSVGAMLHAGPNKVAMGVDLNCTHHRAVRSGLVTGVATPAHTGRTSATYDITITDEAGKRVCTARLTCALRPAVSPRAADPGDAAPAS